MKLNNKQKINNINNSIDNIYRQLDVLKRQLAELTNDTIDEICCDNHYDSKIEFDKHRESVRCKVKRGVPHFKCNRCNNLFFDGYNSMEELYAHPTALLKSSYRAHCEGCPSRCERCGIDINTFYMKKNHVCADIKVEKKIELKDKKNKKPKFHIKKEKTPEPSPEPPPEYSSEDEEVIMEVEVKDKQDKQVEDKQDKQDKEELVYTKPNLSKWIEESFNGVKYTRNRETNKLYDWDSNPVGWWIEDENRAELDSDLSTSEEEEEEEKVVVEKRKFKIKKKTKTI